MGRISLTHVLLLANVVVMTFPAMTFFASLNVKNPLMTATSKETFLWGMPSGTTPDGDAVTGNGTGVEGEFRRSAASPSSAISKARAKGQIGTTDSKGIYFVEPRPGERNFYEIGTRHQTDKTDAPRTLPPCLKHNSTCTRPGCVRQECRPWGHHYDTIYQRWIGPYSQNEIEPFQFLEIGFYNGKGYDTYREFMPRGECHSMEISCIEPGPRNEGKWPWGNFAEKNPRYQQYLDERLLHCGDANDVVYLDSVWKQQMKRPDAPPLKVVVDDGAHHSDHMAQSVFFWLPRIEPRGLLIVEDVQPISDANAFRSQFLPQIMKDLHFCGDPKEKPDQLCFPALHKFLASVHCEMHICVFERSDAPAEEPSLEDSKMPKDALDLNKCQSMLHGHW